MSFRIYVCDSDTATGVATKSVESGMTVREYFNFHKGGADINNYTVLVNSVSANANTPLYEGCTLTISKKKMAGACRLRHLAGKAAA